jgi:hypothetical protein
MHPETPSKQTRRQFSNLNRKSTSVDLQSYVKNPPTRRKQSPIRNLRPSKTTTNFSIDASDIKHHQKESNKSMQKTENIIGDQ